MPADSIGVVTLTRHRPDLLTRRALRSVQAQDYAGHIDHLVVLDDDPDSLAAVAAAPSRPDRRVLAHLEPRPPAEVGLVDDRHTVYPRMSRLVNIGVRACRTDWVAILDDDNAFEPHHLSSLWACAVANDADAVHSCRAMFTADEQPFVDERWHTVADPAESARIYRLMCDRGVRVPGTNLMLDRADPGRPDGRQRPSSVLRPEDPIFFVDQNVWLVRRELILAHPFPEEFSVQDYEENKAPDDKFLERLLLAGVTVHSTGLPTVRYYLGGISNNPTGYATATVR